MIINFLICSNILLIFLKVYEISKPFFIRVFFKKFLEQAKKLWTFLKTANTTFKADYAYLLLFRNGDTFTAGNKIMRVELADFITSDDFSDINLFDTDLKSMRINKFLEFFLKLEKEKFLTIDASADLSEFFHYKKALRERGMMIGYYHAVYDKHGEMSMILCFEYSEKKMPAPFAPYPAKVVEAITELKFIIEK